MTKVRRLASAFTYSTPYTTDADTGLATIHAYSEQAAERKRRFLHDASQLLLAVGRELRGYGFTASKVRTNEAGIAVSGEVYGHYGQEWGAREIFLTVDTTCLNIVAPKPAPGEPLVSAFGMTCRADGIVVVGRWYGPRPKGRGSAPMGPERVLRRGRGQPRAGPGLAPPRGLPPGRDARAAGRAGLALRPRRGVTRRRPLKSKAAESRNRDGPTNDEEPADREDRDHPPA